MVESRVICGFDAEIKRTHRRVDVEVGNLYVAYKSMVGGGGGGSNYVREKRVHRAGTIKVPSRQIVFGGRSRIAGALTGTGYINDLRKSIIEHGLMSPLVVTPRSKNVFFIVDGMVRLEAIRGAILTRELPRDYEVECVVKKMTAKEIREYRMNSTPGYAHLLSKNARFAAAYGGKMISISTPQGDDIFRNLFEHQKKAIEQAGKTLWAGVDLGKTPPNMVILDESSELKSFYLGSLGEPWRFTRERHFDLGGHW